MDIDSALEKLDAYYQAMPPVAAMHLRIAHYDGERLRLRAPLAYHVNDKGCAFGGSLNSLMTLAAWGLVSMRLEAAGLRSDVYVADNRVRYLAPLFADLEAEAEISPEAAWDEFIAGSYARKAAPAPTSTRMCACPTAAWRRTSRRASSPSPKVRMGTGSWGSGR